MSNLLVSSDLKVIQNHEEDYSKYIYFKMFRYLTNAQWEA